MGASVSVSDDEREILIDRLPDTTQNRSCGIRRQWIGGIIASLGMWAMGSALGWSSPSVPQLENGQGIEKLTKDEVSWIASLIMLASIPGCFLGGYLADKLGRRMTCMLAVFPFTLGWGMVAGAQNAWMLIVGRIVTGTSAGTYFVTSAVYCAEIADERMRSILASWNVISLCLGILYTYIIGALVSWRINTIICGVTPLLHLIGMIFLPETPRFLVVKGDRDLASKSLQWYRGANSEEEIHPELEKIVNDVNEGSSNDPESVPSTDQKIWVASTVKPVLICLACAAFQQLSGTSAVTFYTVNIFKSAGSNIEPNVSAIIYGATQVIATGFTGYLMTKFGRRPLFIFSEVGMSVSLAILGVFYYLKENQPEKADHLGWLPLVSLATYTITYSCGAGILPWTLMVDLCPPHVKGLGLALCTATTSVLGFLVTLIFPRLLIEIQGYGVFWLFSGICVLGTVFMALVLPETKDKTMDEIMSLFKNSRSSPE